MTTEALSKLHQASPFRPFDIRLGDGQVFPVAQPEMLAYAPKQQTAFLYSEDGSFEIIDLPQIIGLEIHSRKRGGGK